MTRPLNRSETMRRVTERAAEATRALSVAEFTDRVRESGRDADTLFGNVPGNRLEAIAAGELQRDGLVRTVGFITRDDVAGTSQADGYNIEGYGAVFDSETEINSWEGNFTEKIRKGAFRKTLRETTPKMQFDHGHHPLLGGLPLGRWSTAEEDTKGLHLAGRLYKNWMVEPFRDAIADGSVDGMSFRFSVVREEWRDGAGTKITDDHELFDLLYYGAGDRGPITRELIEVKCPEAGPVVWPAYADTEVGARSADGGTLTIDLAALRADPRRLADFAALVDAEAARSERSDLMAAADARLAAVTGSDEVVHTAPVHTGTADEAEARDTEPLATERPADEHPTAPDTERAAPPDTGDSAGEHSSGGQRDRRPVNPTERRALIRGEYRSILERTLALPES